MRKYRQRKRQFGSKLTCFLLAVVMCLTLFNYARPWPQTQASLLSSAVLPKKADLVWPEQGSAAVSAKGFGVLATHGQQTPVPIASLAKVVTVLAILEKRPLKLGQKGPAITMTKKDVALFNHYFGLGGAYVKVEAGERITEYQALQAILLPSANNMADSTAIWAFGSMDNYITYANAMVKRLGLLRTNIETDASGFSPDTTSTTTDLVRLGELAMNHPVVAEIIALPSAVIPMHGIIYSANARLGYRNIIGIKTGLSDEAKGCFLFAAKHQVEGSKPITIVGVIIGASTLRAALGGSIPLINSAKTHFRAKTLFKAHETFATIATPWSATSEVTIRQDVKLIVWNGAIPQANITLSKINGPLATGTKVGTAIIGSKDHAISAPLFLKKDIAGPGWWWRISRFY